MPRKYKPVTVQAITEVAGDLVQFRTSINAAGVEISNILLNYGERASRKLTPQRKKPYPPSRNRVPGTMKRSIHTVKSTEDHPGKNVMQSWLWEWIDNFNRRKAAAGGTIQVHKRVGKTRGVARFKKMIKTDPRRLLAWPLEKEVTGLRGQKVIRKELEKAIDKTASRPDLHKEVAGFVSDYKKAWNSTHHTKMN